MANLYVTSVESFSGKSALCIGLGIRFRSDGLKPGYMKPVNVNAQLRDGVPFDDDVVFAREIFQMPDQPSAIGPVALTPVRLAQQLGGPEIDYESRLVEAYNRVSAGHDIMVLEGGRSWLEGYVAGLPARRVVELLDARTLMVLKYNEAMMLDRALAARDYIGDSLIGVVINEAPTAQTSHIYDSIVPYLQRHHLPVLGVLPNEPSLGAPTVAELAIGLHAEVLCGSDLLARLVEQMMVGAMRGETALQYFRRVPNKAVITGGDRADIQMAALETSTRCLILSGNLYPSPGVLNRADELGVPVLLTEMDTLAATETVAGFLGRSRFQQSEKIERFTELVNENIDFEVLYRSLGITIDKDAQR